MAKKDTSKRKKKKSVPIKVKGPAYLQDIEKALELKVQSMGTELFEHGDKIVIQIDHINPPKPMKK